MLGKEHRHAFIIANPTGVSVSTVRQMRREQRVEVIIGKLSLQRFEANFLQHDVTVRIGEDFLSNAVATAIFRVC